MTAAYREYPDGTREYDYIRERNGFDPADHTTGRTWVAYTDSNGKRYEAGADFYFDQSKADLKNVAALLNFISGGEADAVNSFMGNLQLYPINYFSSLLAQSRLNLQA